VIAIPLIITSNHPEIELCEDKTFEAELNFILPLPAGETPSITWYKTKNGVTTQLPETSKTLQIASVKPEDSGIYSYKITNRGCAVEDTIVGLSGSKMLNVSGKIALTPLPEKTICSGEQDTIGFSTVSPATTQLTWKDDGTIIKQLDNLTVIVEPPYNPAVHHRYVHTYKIDAINGYCSMKDIPVTINVDEPLNGNIAGKLEICEGDKTTLDASTYQADSYIWTSTAYTGEKHGSVQTEGPSETTTYTLTVTRGACAAVIPPVTVTVNSQPRIYFIDSTGVRDRLIVPLDGYGTLPFTFGVDNKPLDNEAEKRGLLFGKHTFYIEDDLGCRSETTHYVLEAPKLFPPAYFSPNGDGIKDTWDIPNIRDIYPDAVVAIYDRFGKKIIEYKGSDTGWDGKYLGHDMPTTDYWYEIDIDEVDKQYVGHFTLLRK
jgi:gliding motility-associated-like protein